MRCMFSPSGGSGMLTLFRNPPFYKECFTFCWVVGSIWKFWQQGVENLQLASKSNTSYFFCTFRLFLKLPFSMHLGKFCKLSLEEIVLSFHVLMASSKGFHLLHWVIHSCSRYVEGIISNSFCRQVVCERKGTMVWPLHWFTHSLCHASRRKMLFFPLLDVGKFDI